MWDNPGAFGISDIIIPKHQDLSADLYFFKSSGMDREKAFQLYREFSGINKILEEVSPCKEVRIWDKVIPMRYDLAKIVAAEKQYLDTTNQPFVQWLKKMNRIISPFKPVNQPSI
jgi:hypothetical protein